MMVSQAGAADWKVSADLRERIQVFDNLDFNSRVDDHHWEWNNRLYVKADVKFGHGLGVYLQPQAIYIQDHPTAGGSVNLTQADLHQAYLQYGFGDFDLRLGRQELVYGDQRLLGRLGWKDVARTFDGIKGIYRSGLLSVDVFAVHPADIVAMTPSNITPRGKSLVTWEDRRLLGAYSTYRFASQAGVDAYYINWHHNQKATVGPGRSIHTFGARLFGEWGGFDTTGEFVWQRGRWTNHVSQEASALAVKAGYTFAAWKTRLGVEFDFSPGDDKTDPNRHGDFVFPFHTNHAHYGEMDRFSWANMRDLRFSLKTSPVSGLKLLANVHLLWLDEARGDWLNVAGTGVLFAGNPAFVQNRAGTEVDLKIVYKPEAIKGLKLVANYSVFSPGGAVRERNNGNTDRASFAYVIGSYVF
jgi:hypothetical protein